MKGDKEIGNVAREHLTGKMLEEQLQYYSSSGEFQWRNSKDPYSEAGTRTNGGIIITLLGTRYKAEDLAWFYTYGHWPEERLVHIDGDNLNNAIDNLGYPA